MERYVEFTLADGTTIYIESNDSTNGVVKASRGADGAIERAHQTFDEAAENARKAALIILEKMRGLHESPEKVEITFGLKASGELGSLVVAKAGIEASYSIKLTWKAVEPSSPTAKSCGVKGANSSVTNPAGLNCSGTSANGHS